METGSASATSNKRGRGDEGLQFKIPGDPHQQGPQVECKLHCSDKKKAQQRLYFLRMLKKTNISAKLIESFYHCTLESILTYCITSWYGNCSVADRAALQRVINTVGKIIGLSLPRLEDIYKARCCSRACRIIKYRTHPLHHLFTLVPSGRQYRALKCHTARLRDSFYPKVIYELNSGTAEQLHMHFKTT